MVGVRKSAIAPAAICAVIAALSIGAAFDAPPPPPVHAVTMGVRCNPPPPAKRMTHALWAMLHRYTFTHTAPASRRRAWHRLTAHPALALRLANRITRARYIAVRCRPSTAHPPHVVPKTVATPPFSMGVSYPQLTYGMASATQQVALKDMKANLHLSSVRIDASWSAVQRGGPTSYSWKQLDQTVANIRAAGLSTNFVITGCPPWASASGGQFAQPTDPAQFAGFAGAVAARYGRAGTNTFEIWNEPNIVKYWSTGPDVAAYTRLLIDASSAIKSAVPGATVISAGLSPAKDDGTNIAPATFLEGIYTNGGRDAFDAVGDHPYSFDAYPNTYEAWSGWSQMSATPVSIRSVMTANGDAAKKVDITEVGWPTNHAALDGTPGPMAQAVEAAQVIAFAKTHSWIGKVYWYGFKDTGTSTTDKEQNFGLSTAAGAHKPAYSVIATR
jgi:hypothetical protein